MLRRLRRKPQLRIALDTAEIFGSLAATLRKAGKNPNVRINDLWLAAQAIQRGFRLLTSNAKDFADVQGLLMVVLKTAAAPAGTNRRPPLHVVSSRRYRSARMCRFSESRYSRMAPRTSSGAYLLTPRCEGATRARRPWNRTLSAKPPTAPGLERCAWP